jgi:hypothetical protein
MPNFINECKVDPKLCIHTDEKLIPNLLLGRTASLEGLLFLTLISGRTADFNLKVDIKEGQNFTLILVKR